MKNYDSFKKRMNLVIIQYKSQQSLTIYWLSCWIIAFGADVCENLIISKFISQKALWPGWTENGYDSWDSHGFFENHDFQM